MSERKPIEQDEVARIARLSKISLQGDELEKLTQDFNQILQFVGQVEEAGVQDDLQFDNPLHLHNISRSDTPHTSLPIEEVRKLTPNFESGFFVVPKVIES